jgi:HEAT repeat protein
VRWWGAAGSALLDQEPAGLATLLQDPVAAVRIVAAESILRRRSDPAAIAVFNAVLGSSADWPTRLAAANSISRLADRAPFRAALEATKQDEEYTRRIVPWLLGE